LSKKPKTLITIGAIVLVIMAFATIQFNYQDGKFSWQKVPISSVIDAVKGVKHKSSKSEKISEN